MTSSGYGLAGRVAAFFLDLKITPLLMISALLLGALAIARTPREEEPQIVVPFADVLVALPGAAPDQIEQKVTRPLERLFLEIPGVEYVYATSVPDRALITVRFRVGDDLERSLVKLYDAIAGAGDLLPADASPPLVKARSIDDVPFLTLTLSKETGDGRLLRNLAAVLEEEIRSVPEVSVTRLSGGRRGEVEVRLDAAALAEAGLSPGRVLARLRADNVSRPGGEIVSGGRASLVRTHAFLRTAEDVAQVVVGVVDGRPIRLGSVADVSDTPEVEEFVTWMTGAAAASEGQGTPAAGAVTLTVAKRKGSDATRVAETVLERVETVKGRLIPEDVHLAVTRNFGETADEKATDLLKHLLGAIFSVAVVIALALGIRGSLVVFISVPITFALTLFTYYLFGYTLNRVTLFALIFVTGIVVDDSIIIVENIYRHFRERKTADRRATLLSSVSEVGNPTVLATFTVIASVFPMAYVGGLMGPYMKPMPIGATLAMIFSLLVAVTIAPWLSHRLLVASPASDGEDPAGESAGESAPPGIRKLYDRVLGPLLEKPRRGVWTLVGVSGLLLLSMLLLPLKAVTVKMLPFDNKSEIQVLVDMPEGTPLEATAAAAHDVASAVASVPEVTNLQVYVGTAAPITFNGLVRHYDLRQSPRRRMSMSTSPTRRTGSERATRWPPSFESWRCPRPGGTERSSRSSRSLRDHRFCRPWSPRCTAPTRLPGWSWRPRCDGSWNPRRASWMWTGRSRTPSRSGNSRWIELGLLSPASTRPRWPGA